MYILYVLMHSFYEIKIKMHSSFLFILLGPIIIHTHIHTYALTFILHLTWSTLRFRWRLLYNMHTIGIIHECKNET